MFGTPALEVVHVIELQHHNFICLSFDRSIDDFGIVEVRHAIYPRIHVATVVIRKPKRIGKHIMECVPIENTARIESNQQHVTMTASGYSVSE